MDPAPSTAPDPLKKSKRSPLILVNQRASSESSSTSAGKKALDSSLKRHLSLLNRLRKNFSLEFKDAVLKDVEGLTLEKYAEEIVDACLEGVSGLGGKGDVFAVVEILTALNSRLSPDVFSTPLLTSFLALLGPPNSAALKALPADQRDREEKERVTKQRGVLRVLAEAEACGLRLAGGTIPSSGRKSKTVVLEEVVGMGWCIEEGLKGLLASDPLYTSLPLFTSFLKSYGRVYLGPPPVASDPSQDPRPGEAPNAVEEELVPVEMQTRLKALFDAYYDGLGKVVARGRVRLQQQDLKNHEAYIKSGEIFEDRQQAYEKMTKEVERLMAGMISLADLLHLPPPVFPALATSKGNSSVLVLDNSSSNPFARDLDDIPVGGMWEDEEERKFYEDIIDLSELVPAGILGIKEKTEDEKEKDKAVEAGAEQERKEREEREADDIQRQLESLEEGAEVVPNGTEESSTPETAGEAEAIALADSVQEALDIADVPTVVPDAPTSAPTDDTGAPLPAGPLARLNIIFAALPEITSKAALDQLAVDFAFLNSKPSRKRIVKFLGAVPKNRSDLLPMYARLAATLNPFMPDVGQGLIAILDEEFRYLQRKKLVKELAEVRSKNIRFYCELAKFKVAQPHTILHVYKTLIDDLTGSNVECAALLLEGCGRFLLRSEETGERMKKMLELMRRKQGAQHFDQRLLLLLENAYYQCNPPERAAVQQKERPQMEQFIRHLIHDILIKKTVDKVLRLMRKLHWEDSEVVRVLHKCFTKVWKIKFSNIGALAILTFEVARHHSDFATGVVDQVLEDIRVGLETNIFKHNQRRIATIKYLGELHYYRQVSSPVIFDVLWSLITFGHSEPIPVPGRSCPVDSPDDFFRVRLICTLLDTCGMCFDKGSTKKKLDQFLTIFQLYVMCKKDAPMDVDFMISDTFDAIRPDLVPFKTFEEVGAAVDELLASQALSSAVAGDNDSDASGSEDGDDERREDDLEGEGDANGIADELDSSDESDSEDEVDDDLVLQRLAKAQALAREEEDAFNREFSKMLLEQQSEVKKGDRKTNVPIFDSAVPLMRKAKASSKALEEEASSSAAVAVPTTEQDSGLMKFMLLTKKGNKPQTRMMDIPFDSPIAVNTRSNQMLDKLEQQQMKTLVLKHEERQELGEKQSLEALARARGIKLKFVGGGS